MTLERRDTPLGIFLSAAYELGGKTPEELLSVFRSEVWATGLHAKPLSYVTAAVLETQVVFSVQAEEGPCSHCSHGEGEPCCHCGQMKGTVTETTPAPGVPD